MPRPIALPAGTRSSSCSPNVGVCDTPRWRISKQNFLFFPWKRPARFHQGSRMREKKSRRVEQVSRLREREGHKAQIRAVIWQRNLLLGKEGRAFRERCQQSYYSILNFDALLGLAAPWHHNTDGAGRCSTKRYGSGYTQRRTAPALAATHQNTSRHQTPPGLV